MRQKENYSSQITVALGLTLAIIGTFQAYIVREPARIQADIQAEHEISLAAGKGLYAGNCISCHGADGKGDNEIPRLAGLEADYLLEQIQAFASGERVDEQELMAMNVEDLSTQEMADLAAYYAALK